MSKNNNPHVNKTCISCHRNELAEVYYLKDTKEKEHTFCFTCAGNIWHLADEFTHHHAFEHAVKIRVDESIWMAGERTRRQNRGFFQQVYERIVDKTPMNQSVN